MLDVGTREILLAGETGYARLEPSFTMEFNDTLLDPGECLKVDGNVQQVSTRTESSLLLQLSSDEELDTVGTTEEPPNRPPQELDATFSTSYVDGGVEILHEDGVAIPVDELEVRMDPEAEFALYDLTEVADVEPGTELEPGESVVVSETGEGYLHWRQLPTWSHDLTSWLF